jgi:ubiquinone/menaquinone biosynthesis C-methylase UbiE
MRPKSNSGDIERFSRWARSYESSRTQNFLVDRVHRAVLELLLTAEPRRVLDVGCGTGRLLRTVGERWPAAQLAGVDAAEGMVEEARRLMPTATFYTGVAEALPLPDASADLVLSTLSFHHWHDRAAGVREVGRVLEPGGRFVLADFLMPPGLARFLRPLSPNSPHLVPLDFAILQGLFAQAGLRAEVQRRVMRPFAFVSAAVKG